VTLRRIGIAGAAAAVLLVASAGEACAQRVRRSQHGTVSQTVAATEVSVSYNRPVARGRTLFGPGGVVPYGRPWCPGADDATSVQFSDDVVIEGQELAAGRYTLWAIPDAQEWVVIFSTAVDVWHTPYPGEARDALRIRVTPTAGEHMEAMAYYFPEVGPDTATLRFHWGTVVVPIHLRVAS
jgi:hypothetical protein